MRVNETGFIAKAMLKREAQGSMNTPLITAHSGCEGTPRDSLESVVRAIELGVDAVEVDVRMDPAGVLRISHDKQHDAAAYATHASLEQVFALLGPTSLSINCDLKEHEHLYALFALAKRHAFGRERLILSGSVSPEQLSYDPGIVSKATVYMNIEELFKYLFLRNESASLADFTRLMTEPWAFTRSYMKQFDAYIPLVVEFARYLGIEVINTPYQYLQERHFAALEVEKFRLSLWTVDDREALQSILSFSVSNLENVTTRHVSMTKSLMESRRTVVSKPLQ